VGRNAAQYGFDTSRIVVTGGSAGGHLALITGMLPPESPFYRSCPTSDETRWQSGAEPRVRVAAIVNWFGICDVADLLEGPTAKHYAIEWFGSMSNPKDLARRLSPLTYAGAGSPPTITIHGDRDDIVPYAHAVNLHAALEKANVPNKLVTVTGAGHGGFDRKTLVSGFAAVREFLRANGILRQE
jgi:acetyl esterase/lipase